MRPYDELARGEALRLGSLIAAKTEAMQREFPPPLLTRADLDRLERVGIGGLMAPDEFQRLLATARAYIELTQP